MYSKIMTAVNWGIEGQTVEIETNIFKGLPNHIIVGLPSMIIKESKERVKSALKATGFRFPSDRIVQNLYPANLKKEGSQMDLPIAMGIITSVIEGANVDFTGFGFLGELSLDGKIQPVSGILSLIEGMKASFIKHIVIPKANFSEAQYIEAVTLYPYDSLKKLVDDAITGTLKKMPKSDVICLPEFIDQKDISDIIGQNAAIRAAQIATAGFHNLLIIGPPGCGKSMLAERLRSIMPPMSLEHKIEVTKVYGICDDERLGGLITHRPFRAPHHTISRIGLVGGGTPILPGEISKAHRGVLYLDELGEYKCDAIDALREPMSSGVINLTKGGKSLSYPAQFMLVATMNPCPCGHYMSSDDRCTCTQYDIKKYFGKISWPILDRLDMTIYMNRVENLETILTSRQTTLTSEKMRASVETAQHFKKDRDNNEEKHIWMTKDAESVILKFHEKGKLSMRSYEKLVSVSRTIADLDQSMHIEKKHVLEAYSYQTANQIKRFFE
ncbi:MAG TPA: magnesium chelatase [Clostridiales bacterium UBA8960]|nr:magnesium chelatase [Clostridiales bacterium UBA8960]